MAEDPGANTVVSRNISVSFGVLIALILVAAVAIAVLSWNVWQNHKALDQAHANQREVRALAVSTRDTFCVVRTNLAGRLARAEEYNADVKSGKRPLLPGFSLRELEKDVAEQQATLTSLGGLRCEEGS